MLKLYMGGFAQGKYAYVMRTNPGAQSGEIPVINHFHLWVKERLSLGQDPGAALQELLERHPDCIIISDEVGNGIVPVAREERLYRETLGRLLIQIAERADRVERVICGLGQRIK